MRPIVSILEAAEKKEDISVSPIHSASATLRSLATTFGLADTNMVELSRMCALAGEIPCALTEIQDQIEIISSTTNHLCGWFRRRNTELSYMGGRFPNEIISVILWHVWCQWDDFEQTWQRYLIGRVSSSLSSIPISPYAENSAYSRCTRGITSPWYELRLVCTKWRDIIDATPALWTSLPFFITDDIDQSLGRFELGMNMSKRAIGAGCLLDFSLCSKRPARHNPWNINPKIDPYTTPMLRKIKSYSTSIFEYALPHSRSFNIEGPDVFVQSLLHLGKISCPNLQTLTLVLHSSLGNSCDDNVVPSSRDVFMDAPKLQHLWLSNEYPSNAKLFQLLTFPWTQLTHLTIRDRNAHPSEIRNILWNCSRNLQVCEIRVKGWSKKRDVLGLQLHNNYLANWSTWNSHTYPTIRFPHLTDLFLDFGRYTDPDPNPNTEEGSISIDEIYEMVLGPIFDYLVLPALQSLRIWTPVTTSLATGELWVPNTRTVEIVGPQALANALKCLQHRSRFSLKRFQLACAGFGEEQLKQFLGMVPELETLDLRETDFAWMGVLEEMLRPDSAFLPNLKHIMIHEPKDYVICDAMYHWQSEALAEVIVECGSLKKMVIDVGRHRGRALAPPQVLPSISTALSRKGGQALFTDGVFLNRGLEQEFLFYWPWWEKDAEEILERAKQYEKMRTERLVLGVERYLETDFDSEMYATY